MKGSSQILQSKRQAASFSSEEDIPNPNHKENRLRRGRSDLFFGFLWDVFHQIRLRSLQN